MSPLASITALSMPAQPAAGAIDNDKLRETFSKSVGEVFYTQMLKSLRQTVGKPAYLHGGNAEEMFESQLDQVLAEKMAGRDGDRLTGELFERFAAGLRSYRPDLTSPSADSSQTAKSTPSVQASPAEQLSQLARQAQAAAGDAGITTGTPATFPTFRK
jgi:Rod binding domain-containing protein